MSPTDTLEPGLTSPEAAPPNIEENPSFKEHSGAKVVLVMLALVLFGSFGIYRFIQKKLWPYRDSFHPVAPGLEYAEMDVGGQVRAHVFRVDLHSWRPIVADARQQGRSTATVRELAEETGAALMINGSFFDVDDAPLGLLISGGQELNPLRRGTDWGVFMVEGERARLAHTRDFSASAGGEATKEPRPIAIEGLDFAIQSGPRIIIDGEVPRLKPQAAPRTALGITRDGRLLIAVTYGAFAYADALGRFLLEELEVLDALLLDGGPSTQLYAKVGQLSIDHPGGTPVANGVGLVPR